MPAGSTYSTVATTTLGSSASDITFSSISGSYTDLILVVNGTGSAGANMGMQFNSDTGTNYSATRLIGEPTGISSDRISNNVNLYVGIMGTNNTTNIVQIQNYSNTTTNKSTLSRASSSTIWIAAMTSMWRNTSAITSLRIYLVGGGTFQTNTTATLYGISAA
jgi:hypothetical protein